jgi:hypothetical protein
MQFGERIIPRVILENEQLLFEILTSLAGQSRCGRVALRRNSVAPGTVVGGKPFAEASRSEVTCQYGHRAENAQENR